MHLDDLFQVLQDVESGGPAVVQLLPDFAVDLVPASADRFLKKAAQGSEILVEIFAVPIAVTAASPACYDEERLTLPMRPRSTKRCCRSFRKAPSPRPILPEKLWAVKRGKRSVNSNVPPAGVVQNAIWGVTIFEPHNRQRLQRFARKQIDF
jgi:hypothetical protein